MPVYKYELLPDGSKKKCSCNINKLLNTNVNDYVTSFNAKKIFIEQAVVHGNGYLIIERDKNFKIVGFIPVENQEVSLCSDDMNKTWYYNISLYGEMKRYEYWEVINLPLNSKNGVEGIGVLKYGSEVLGLETSYQNFLGEVMEQGVAHKGVLYVDSKYNSDQREDIVSRIKGFFKKGNRGKLLVLPDNAKYEKTSLSPTDLEVLESRKFTITQIANLLKLPVHMLNQEAKSGNYKNLEESSRQFLTYTLQPYLTIIEQLLAFYLLTEEEKESGNFIFKFDTQTLVMASAKERVQMLDSAISGGVLSIKEARDIMDLPYIEGTDTLLLSKFNSVIKDGEIINLQTQSSLENGKETSTESEVVEE